MSTIVFSFHDNWDNSKVNKMLGQDVTNVVYVDKDFNVADHQELLQGHNDIILQYPIQWFYGPVILKEWLDKVLSYGFAYGGQYALEGKKFHLAVTLGGVEEAYTQDGPNGVTVEDILKPMYATIQYIKAIPGDIFKVHNVFGLDEARLVTIQQNYHDWLKK